MKPKGRILVVEDDPAMRAGLCDNLEFEGYLALAAGDIRTGLSLATTQHPDLILLDLMLPDGSGLSLCKQLRTNGFDGPIIMLTARAEEMDRVIGLETGADDYVVKPFGIKELIARIHAVMRRASGTVAPVTHIEVGALVIDTKSRTVSVGEKSVAFTPKEFDLLTYLAREPGTVFRRADILRDVWQTTWYGTTKTLDAHVASIRKKLGDPEWVESVRGVGFTLRIVS
jgi:DNA-binding response OmpR family regulator